jgi:hypothetical protein
MSAAMTAGAVLEKVYLDVRCKLLDIAACLDRLERADGSDDIEGDTRLLQLLDGIAILGSNQPDRAERIQMLFSDPYVPNWNRRGGSKTEDRR